jgi:hypothetical protein
MMSVIRPALASPDRCDEAAIDRLEIGQRHMRQDQVLLMADADFVEGVFFGDIGDESIWLSEASPGMPPIGFSEIVTMP